MAEPRLWLEIVPDIPLTSVYRTSTELQNIVIETNRYVENSDTYEIQLMRVSKRGLGTTP